MPRRRHRSHGSHGAEAHADDHDDEAPVAAPDAAAGAPAVIDGGVAEVVPTEAPPVAAAEALPAAAAEAPPADLTLLAASLCVSPPEEIEQDAGLVPEFVITRVPAAAPAAVEAPPAAVEAPPAAVEAPPAAVEAPPAAVEAPPAAVEAPPAAVEAPPAAVEAPPAAVEAPPAAVEAPPAAVEAPPVAVEAPPVAVEAPPAAAVEAPPAAVEAPPAAVEAPPATVEEPVVVEAPPAAVEAPPAAVEAPPATVEEPVVVEAPPAAVEAPPAAVEAPPAAVEAPPAAVEARPAAVEARPAAVEAPPAAVEAPPVAVEAPPAAAEPAAAEPAAAEPAAAEPAAAELTAIEPAAIAPAAVQAPAAVEVPAGVEATDHSDEDEPVRAGEQEVKLEDILAHVAVVPEGTADAGIDDLLNGYGLDLDAAAAAAPTDDVGLDAILSSYGIVAPGAETAAQTRTEDMSLDQLADFAAEALHDVPAHEAVDELNVDALLAQFTGVPQAAAPDAAETASALVSLKDDELLTTRTPSDLKEILVALDLNVTFDDRVDSAADVFYRRAYYARCLVQEGLEHLLNMHGMDATSSNEKLRDISIERLWPADVTAQYRRWLDELRRPAYRVALPLLESGAFDRAFQRFFGLPCADELFTRIGLESAHRVLRAYGLVQEDDAWCRAAAMRIAGQYAAEALAVDTIRAVLQPPEAFTYDGSDMVERLLTPAINIRNALTTLADNPQQLVRQFAANARISLPGIEVLGRPEVLHQAKGTSRSLRDQCKRTLPTELEAWATLLVQEIPRADFAAIASSYHSDAWQTKSAVLYDLDALPTITGMTCSAANDQPVQALVDRMADSINADPVVVLNVFPVTGGAIIGEIGINTSLRYRLVPSQQGYVLIRDEKTGHPLRALPGFSDGDVVVSGTRKLRLCFQHGLGVETDTSASIVEMTIDLVSGNTLCHQLSTIPCAGIDTVCTRISHDGQRLRIPMRRVALVVFNIKQLDAEQRAAIASITKKCLSGTHAAVLESAQVLADALDAIRITHDEEDLLADSTVARVTMASRLLYLLGASIRSQLYLGAVSRHYESHWRATIEATDNPIAQDVLLKLVLGTFTVAVVNMKDVDGLVACLAANGHAALRPRPLVLLSATNYGSVIAELAEARRIPALCFVIIRVIGQLSVSDVRRLVDICGSSQQSLRLVLVADPFVLAALTACQLLDSVVVASSVQSSTTSDVDMDDVVPGTYQTPTWGAYSYGCLRTVASTQATQLLDAQAAADFQQMLMPAEEWARTQQLMLQEEDWVAKESAFRDKAVPGAQSYLLVVADDVGIVESYYRGVARASTTMGVFGTEDDQSTLDRFFASVVASAQPVVQEDMPPTATGVPSPVPSPRDRGSSVPCLIVVNAHLMSLATVEAISYRAMDSGVILVLVVPYLDPNHLELVSGAHVSTAVVLKARCSTEQIVEYARHKDASNVAKLITVVRVLRLLFGNGMQVSRLPAASFTESTWSGGTGHAALAAFATRVVEGQVDPAIVQAAVATTISLVSATTATTTLPGFLPRLIAACVAKVQSGRAFTFQEYVGAHSLAQFMSQKLRFRCWLVQAIAESPAAAMFVLSAVSRGLVDFHCPQPLFLISETITAPMSAPGLIHLQGFVTARHGTIVSPDEAMVTAAGLQQELRWDVVSDTQVFPTNLDMLLKLLRVHPHALKLLVCMEPAHVFGLLRSLPIAVTEGIVADVLFRILQSLQDPQLAGLLAGCLRPHAAVLKWCLASSVLAHTQFSFDSYDLQALIDLKLPLELDGARAGAVLPLIQQLDVSKYRDFLYNQVLLREFLTRMSSTQNVFPRHVAGPVPFHDERQDAHADAAETPALGAVFIEFLTHADILAEATNAAVLNASSLLAHPFVTHLAALLADSEDENLFARVGDDEFEQLPLVPAQFGRFGTQSFTTRDTFWQDFVIVFGSSSLAIWSSYCRLTPAALALLVARCSTRSQARFLAFMVCGLVERLYEPAANEHQPPRHIVFVQTVFDNLCKRSLAVQRLNFMDSVHRADLRIDGLVRSMASVWRLDQATMEARLYAPADRETAMFTATQVALQTGDLSVLQEFTPLPFLSVPGMLRLLLDAFEDHKLGFPFQFQDGAALHQQVTSLSAKLRLWLEDAPLAHLCRRVLQLTNDALRNNQPATNRAVLLWLWAHHPFETVNLRTEEYAFLCALVRQPDLRFKQRVEANATTASGLALFLAAPQHLSTTVFNSFASLYMPECSIDCKTMEVGMVGRADVPSYTLRLTRRPRYMSDPVLEQVSRELMEQPPTMSPRLMVVSSQLHKLASFQVSGQRGPPFPDLDDSSGLCLASATPNGERSTAIAAWLQPDVSSGVNCEILRNNLGALYVSIIARIGRLSFVEAPQPDQSWAFLHNVLWAWLLCLGASRDDVIQWLRHLFPWATENIPAEVDAAWHMPTRHDADTFIPFTSHIEVSPLSTEDFDAFGVNEQAAQRTLQLFEAMLPHEICEKLDRPRPLITSVDLLQFRAHHGSGRAVQMSPTYRQLPQLYCSYLGHAVGKAVLVLEPTTKAVGRKKLIVIDLARLQSWIAQFVDVLAFLVHPRHQGHHEGVVKEMISSFMSAFRVAVGARDPEHAEEGKTELPTPGGTAGGAEGGARAGRVLTRQTIYSAALHSALAAAIGINPGGRTTMLHDEIMAALVAEGLALSKNTVDELAFWMEKRYPHPVRIPHCETVRFWQEPLGVLLTPTEAQTFASDPVRLHLNPPLSIYAATSAGGSGASAPARVARARSGRRSVEAVGAADAVFYAGIARRLRGPAYGPSISDQDADLASLRGVQASHGVILCDDLIELQLWEGAACIRLRPGSAVSLLALHLEGMSADCVYMFCSSGRADPLAALHDVLQSKKKTALEAMSSATVTTTFASHKSAWDFVNRRFADGSCLVLSAAGVVLVKRGAQWVPVLNTMDGLGATPGQPAACGIWDTLHLCSLVGAKLPMATTQLLFNVMRLAWQEYEWEMSQPANAGVKRPPPPASDSTLEALTEWCRSFASADLARSRAILMEICTSIGEAVHELVDYFLQGGASTTSAVASLNMAMKYKTAAWAQDGGNAAMMAGLARLRRRRLVGVEPAQLSVEELPVAEKFARLIDLVQADLQTRPRLLSGLLLPSEKFDKRCGLRFMIVETLKSPAFRGRSNRLIEALVKHQWEYSSTATSDDLESLLRSALSSIIRNGKCPPIPTTGHNGPSEAYTAWTTGGKLVSGGSRAAVGAAGHGLSRQQWQQAVEAAALESVDHFVGPDCEQLLCWPHLSDQSYHASSGQSLVYFVHERCLQPEGINDTDAASVAKRTAGWLIDVLAAPMPEAFKAVVLLKCQFPTVMIPRLPDVAQGTDVGHPSMARRGSFGTAALGHSSGGLETTTLTSPAGVDTYSEVDMDSRVVFYCLCQRCPFPSVRLSMLPLVSESLTSLRSWLVRVGGDNADQYGLRVVRNSDGVDRILRQAGLRCVVLDFGFEYAAQCLTDSDVLLKVKQAVLEIHSSFVYIRGIWRVSDRLWKWCAEFSQRHPWLYIFFEDADTSWLLPENLDRCVDGLAGYSEGGPRSSAIGGSSLATILQPVLYPDLGPPVLKPQFHLESTMLSSNWEEELRQAMSPQQLMPVMLSGPAGIGKSYFVKNVLLCSPEFQQHARHIEKDGSGDEFLSRTVPEVLQSDVLDVLASASLDCRAILVLDEFHMMPMELKRQLLSWAMRHLRTVKLIMISNRLDQDDWELFGLDGEQLAGASTSGVQVVQARGTVEKLIHAVVCPELAKRRPDGASHGTAHSWWVQPYDRDSLLPKDAAAVGFVYMWVRATSSLFGPDMMSLRPIAELTSLVLDAPSPSSTTAADAGGTPGRSASMNAFVTFLMRRQGSLPAEFCRAVVTALWKLYHDWHFMWQFDEISGPATGLTRRAVMDMFITSMQSKIALAAYTRFQERVGLASANAVEFLVLAALTDSRGTACSYPEFVSQANIVQKVYQYHPLTRLACWSWYMLERVNPSSSAQPSTRPLSSAQSSPVSAAGTGVWTCKACISPNDAAATICSFCHQSRDDSEQRFASKNLAIFPVGAISSAPVTRGPGGRPQVPSLTISPIRPEEFSNAMAFKRLCVMFQTQMRAVDMPMRFPRLFLQPGTGRADTCEVVCANVDPRNLDGVIHALQRGYSIDWEAARRFWSRHPISDAHKFNRLLSVWPSALKMLCQGGGAFTSALLSNIRILLKSGDLALAHRCLVLDGDRPLDELADDSSWPPFIAAWQLYRHLPLEMVSSMTLNTASGESLDRLVLLLRWASKFGFDVMDVDDHPQRRSRLLQEHLIIASQHLAATQGWSHIVTLWSHQFSSLLPPLSGAPTTSIDWVPRTPKPYGTPKLTMVEFYYIAQHQYPPKPDWHGDMQTMSMLLRGMASPEAVSELLSHGALWSDTSVAHELASFAAETPGLTEEAQRLLLNLQGWLPKDSSAVHLQALASNFAEALSHMSEDEFNNCVRVAPEWLEALRHHYDRHIAPLR